jgi:hypothetical protein
MGGHEVAAGAAVQRRLARDLILGVFVCAITACVTPETKPPQNPVLAKWASQWGFQPWIMNGEEVYCRRQTYLGSESVVEPPLDCDRARTIERLMRSDHPPSYLAYATAGGFW